MLTDNGTHFTDPIGHGWTLEDIKTMRAEGVPFRCHAFEAACADLHIEHRLTKPAHPWTSNPKAVSSSGSGDASVEHRYPRTKSLATR